MQNLLNVTLSALNQHKHLIVAVPAIGISASIGVRVVYLVAGVGCKVFSKVADVAGNKFIDRMISKGSNMLGNSLINRATSDFLFELKIGAAIAALTAGVIAVPVLLEQPELASLKNMASVEEARKYVEPQIEKFTKLIEEATPVVKERYAYVAEWIYRT